MLNCKFERGEYKTTGHSRVRLYKYNYQQPIEIYDKEVNFEKMGYSDKDLEDGRLDRKEINENDMYP